MSSPQHIVVIGAARSGTKLVRDALAAVAGVGVVPYDVGYVWRYGNEDQPDDVIGPERVTPRSSRFITRFVDRYAFGDPPAVIEKSVGNALRVPLVSRVLPDTVFVHLVRDGVDVAESTRRQWRARPDGRYILEKARHFPLRLAPRYGTRYVGSLAKRLTGADGRVGSWGPRYPGIERDLHECSLLTVCARQWSQSVRRASEDLRRLQAPVVDVRFEMLLSDPVDELARVARACGLRAHPDLSREIGGTISPARVGAGRRALAADELTDLDVEIGEQLSGLGYDRPLTRAPDGEKE